MFVIVSIDDWLESHVKKPTLWTSRTNVLLEVLDLSKRDERKHSREQGP